MSRATKNISSDNRVAFAKSEDEDTCNDEHAKDGQVEDDKDEGDEVGPGGALARGSNGHLAGTNENVVMKIPSGERRTHRSIVLESRVTPTIELKSQTSLPSSPIVLGNHKTPHAEGEAAAKPSQASPPRALKSMLLGLADADTQQKRGLFPVNDISKVLKFFF